MQVQKYDLWLYVPRIMPLNFLLWVFVVALRKRYGCVVTALLLHCCCRGAGGVLLEFSFMGHLKKAFRRNMVLSNP